MTAEQTSAVPRMCSKCGLPLGTTAIRIFDKDFHPECLQDPMTAPAKPARAEVEGLIEQGVQALTTLSKLNGPVGDATFIAGWIAAARAALRSLIPKYELLATDATSKTTTVKAFPYDVDRNGHLRSPAPTGTAPETFRSLEICLDVYGLDYMQKVHVLAKVRGLLAARSALAPADTPDAAREETEVVAGLVAAMVTNRCPRPPNREPDEFTIGECFKSGVCGCDNGVALEAAARSRAP